MVMLTDISEKITELLESQKDKLTWHDGAIPENEVWVKVGGDHGQGRLKFNLAIVNTKNPNSMDNNVLIGMAGVKDPREKMEIIFDSIRKELAHVEKPVWDGKQIKLFFFFLETTIFFVRYTVSLVPEATILACGVLLKIRYPMQARSTTSENSEKPLH